MSFGESREDYPRITTGLASLDELGVLAVRGVDSRKFLQGQSTCDFETLCPGDITHGALCNAKGRMITSFTACRTDQDEVLLSMDRKLVKPTIAQLEKYAAFFKAGLTDASDAYQQLGLAGTGCEQILSPDFPSLPDPGQSVEDNQGNRLASLASGIYLLICRQEKAPALWQSLSNVATAVGLPWWQLQLVHRGLASVTPALSEQLVPQMLNYQATGAVSFSKGCYTGQEVVARMQYLGKLKRRTYLIKADTSSVPEVGAEISTAEGQHVGTVALAAPEDDKHIAMLAVLREAALDQKQLIIDGESVAITLEDLPYSLDAQ